MSDIISKAQQKEMEHCLGLNYKKKPYRNYFFINKDDENWNDLVNKGLAIKSNKEPNKDGCVYYWLSKQGVEYILKRKISEEYYNKL